MWDTGLNTSSDATEVTAPLLWGAKERQINDTTTNHDRIDLLEDIIYTGLEKLNTEDPVLPFMYIENIKRAAFAIMSEEWKEGELDLWAEGPNWRVLITREYINTLLKMTHTNEITKRVMDLESWLLSMFAIKSLKKHFNHIKELWENSLTINLDWNDIIINQHYINIMEIKIYKFYIEEFTASADTTMNPDRNKSDIQWFNKRLEELTAKWIT